MALHVAVSRGIPQGKHPTYNVHLRYEGTSEDEAWAVTYRFNRFRDLREEVCASDPRWRFAAFPKSSRSQSLGVKLNKSALEARRQGLEEWVAHLLHHRSKLSEQGQQAVANAFALMDHPPPAPPSLPTAPSSTPSPAKPGRTLLKRLASPLAAAPAPAPPPAEAPGRGEDLLVHVAVRRAAPRNGHPMYEVRLSNASHLHTVECRFGAFRALDSDLQHQQVTINASFPPTLKKSSLGLALSDQQLSQRCNLLDKWLKATVAAAGAMPDMGLVALRDFLRLDECGSQPLVDAIYDGHVATPADGAPRAPAADRVARAAGAAAHTTHPGAPPASPEAGAEGSAGDGETRQQEPLQQEHDGDGKEEDKEEESESGQVAATGHAAVKSTPVAHPRRACC